jgi:hypothetical protein
MGTGMPQDEFQDIHGRGEEKPKRGKQMAKEQGEWDETRLFLLV